MLALMHEAGAAGRDVVVYPEFALTTFFPRWFIEDQEEIGAVFERRGRISPPAQAGDGLG